MTGLDFPASFSGHQHWNDPISVAAVDAEIGIECENRASGV